MALGKLRKTASGTSTAKDRPSSPTMDVADVPKSSKRIKPRLAPELDPGPPSNEPQMDSEYQNLTMVTLIAFLKWLWRDRTDYFCSGNMSIYYYVKDPKSGRRRHRKLVFRGPDFFVVKNPFPKPTRNSWLVDNEGGKFPDFIVEVLSPKTKANDLGEKKKIYEKTFKTPNYFIIDPKVHGILGYHLVGGRYVDVVPTAEGLYWIESLGMFMGMYDDPLYRERLPRFFGPDKQLIPGAPEDALKQMARAAHSEKEKMRAEQERMRAEQERMRAEQERMRAEQERMRAEEKAVSAEQERMRLEEKNARLVEKLRSLGIHVDD